MTQDQMKLCKYCPRSAFCMSRGWWHGELRQHHSQFPEVTRDPPSGSSTNRYEHRFQDDHGKMFL